MILAATERELKAIITYVTEFKPVEKNFLCQGGLLYEGRLANIQVQLAVTGIGKSNASMITFQLLEDAEIQLVIQTGCSGAFPQAGIQIGDVVIANREIFADEGVLTQEGFLDLCQIGQPMGTGPLGNPFYNEIPLSAPQLEISVLENGLDFNVNTGPIATISTSTGTADRAHQLYERWQPLAEAMEGAAAALASLRRQKPFIEIRGISNLVGERNREKWEIDRACKNAAKVLIRVIETIK